VVYQVSLKISFRLELFYGVREFWCLPNTFHSYFLPILSQFLPLFDEIRRRSINFIRSCLSNESSLVRHISQYAASHKDKGKSEHF